MNTKQMNWMVQFPVSTAVEGAACFSRMAEMGIRRTVSCTVIYSPYRLVMPRYPHKGIYSLEEGLYYYRPEASRYRDLPVAPRASRDFAGRDLLAEAVSGARGAGLAPCSWVTLFANGMIAKTHPDWAVHNLYDAADRLFLCTNHPEVREYSARVCEEIVERYDVEELLLDKIPQTCMELNAFAGRVDPVLRTLGSFCFCPHCCAAAAREGIDLAGLKERARALAAQALSMPPHLVAAQADELTGDTEIPLLLLDYPWILDILRFRINAVRRFLAELRQRLDARRRVFLSLCFVPPSKIGHDASSPRAWLAAQSYAAYADAAADMIHNVVHWNADIVEYNTRRAVAALEGAPMTTCTHIRAYGATNPADLPGLAAAARRGGAAGVGYFCYDLATEAMLDAIASIEQRASVEA